MFVDNNNPITFVMILVQINVRLEYPVNNSNILGINVSQKVFRIFKILIFPDVTMVRLQ